MIKFEEILDKLQKYFNQSEYDDALLYLEKLINEKINNELKSLIHYYIGRIYYYKNKISEAEEAFIRSLESNKKKNFSYLYLGLIASKQKKPHSAVKLLSTFAGENEDFPQVKDIIVKTCSQFECENESINELIPSSEIHSELNEQYNVPKISIIILCYNKIEHTQRCLESLFKNTKYPNFEVIVVDNASVDNTPALLESYGGKIKFIRSETNLGFVGGNNFAVKHAEGEYFLFLNNDTKVTENWLINLYNTFVEYPDAGAAGSMLVYPDGVLQEAGGAIFNDATGWNYGKGGSTIDAKFSFVREVDYCSGASLMVRRDLFMKHGMFDERFAPAYYEDTDLCFGIRKLGYKVYYNPLSVVIHFEGATAGTDISKGFKKYQEINKPKFINKWKQELEEQYPPDPQLSYFFSNRKKGKRILIIDDIPPLPDRAAGALRHYHTLKQMLKLGYKVTYVHLMGKEYSNERSKKYLNEFKMMGVEFVWFNYEAWWQYRHTDQAKEVKKHLIASLDLKLRRFDLIYIAFWYIADYFVDIIKKEVPNVPILIDTMDVHYLREIRQAELTKDKKQLENAKATKIKELAVYSKADCITTVTEKDRDILKKDLKDKSILILTDVHDSFDSAVTFEERKDFVFVGNFNHTPNEDAVIYFVEKIFPLIKVKIPDAKFYIVGNKPTNKIQAIQSKDIIVTGWVPEVKPYLEKCRVSVVPLRYGAGNKGKVGETLSHGLPMVSTTVGAEGMNIVSGIHSFVSDDPQTFADYAVRLYTEKETWQSFSEAGKKLIASQYSSGQMRQRLSFIMSFESKEQFKSIRALNNCNPPKVSIILVTYNQWRYTKECLQSIRDYTNENYEVIVVDNKSTDETVKKIEKEFPEVRLFRNKENLGFPVAVNIGLTNALGEYYLLLNNDTVVTDGWLNGLLNAVESHLSIGMAGPISNKVSGPQLDTAANYSTLAEMHSYSERIKKENKNIYIEFPRLVFLCTIIKKEVVDAVGGLDERFSPGNFEDDDFSLRMNQAGYKAIIAKDVFIHHYGSKSFTADGKEKYLQRLQINQKVFADKWGAEPEAIWLKNENFKSRNIKYPINLNRYVQFLERAFICIQDSEYKSAAENLEKSIELFGKYPKENFRRLELENLYNMLGNLYLILKDYELSKQYFEKALALDPESSEACEGLGEVLLVEENYDGAKVMFEWALKFNPDNRQAQIRLNELNESSSAPEEPESSFNSTINLTEELSVKLQEVLFAINSLVENKNYDDAEKLLTQAQTHFTSINPDENLMPLRSAFAALYGFTQLGLKNINMAKESFEEALQLNPNSSEACRGLGEILFAAEQDEEAKVMFEWAVKNDPENQNAINKLREINTLLGYPADHNSLVLGKEEILNEAYTLFAEKRFSEAVKFLDEAESSLNGEFKYSDDAQFSSAFYNLKGFNYLALNLSEKARGCFENALTFNPESAKACYGLGEVFYLSKDDKAAKTMFEWAVKNDPSDLLAAEGLKKVNRILNYNEHHNSLLEE